VKRLKKFFPDLATARDILEYQYEMPDTSFGDFWTSDATQDDFVEFAYENQKRYAIRAEDGTFMFDMDTALEAFFRSRNEYPFHPDKRIQLCMLHAQISILRARLEAGERR